MQRVFWESLEPGMVIARTVVGLDGRSLLTENTRLTESYIERLKALGIRSIFIKDGLADVEIPAVISEQVLAAVSGTLDKSIKNITNRNLLNIDNLKRSVSLLIEDIMSNRHLLIQLEDIRSHDDYLFLHSINVAVFSIMMGMTMNYTEEKLMELGLGALLHDIGMIMVDQSILKKETALNTSELEIVRRHPEIGFNILRTYREVSTMSAHIAFQHHERVDGTGYPRLMEGKQIIEYAKVVAVADTFDAVVSDRPYRNGYSSSEAITILKKLSNSYFEPEIVDALIANIARYPVGSILLLNSGNLALVTGVTKANANLPEIHIISDPIGGLLTLPFKVELNNTNKYKIVRKLNEEEVKRVKALIRIRQNLENGSQNRLELTVNN